MTLFEKWSRDRNLQGTPAHAVRAIYAQGLSYAQALKMFCAYFIAEALADCGDNGVAADEIQVTRAVVYRHLKKFGLPAKEIRRMPKELVVGGRKKEEAVHGSK